MKNNIRDYKRNGNQFAYVLDSITVTNFDGNGIDATDKEKVKYFFDTFEQDYNYSYNKKLYPNLQDRIASYLQGLPSCINVAFENYAIIEIGKSWGYCTSERKESEFINNWSSFIAFRLIKLKEYFNL